MSTDDGQSVVSTQHGRLRRQQRNISKKDWKKALQKGKRQQQPNGRWKIELDNRTYILSADQKHEVTCYENTTPEPIHISKNMIKRRNKAKYLLNQPGSSFCPTSHTILLVDVSGSMSTQDLPLHPCRRSAAYNLAVTCLVGATLQKGSVNERNVLSLIEFDRNPRQIIVREPITWVLYNQLLKQQRDYQLKSSTSQRRECEMKLDETYGDSHYLPALEQVEQLLRQEEETNNKCALSLVFLSDGKPTDGMELAMVTASPKTEYELRTRLRQQMRRLAERYCHSLSLSMVGIGAKDNDFSLLESMVNASKPYLQERAQMCLYDGTKKEESYCVLEPLVAPMQTRWALANQHDAIVASKYETASIPVKWTAYVISSQSVFSLSKNQMVQFKGLPPGVLSHKASKRYKFNPPRYAFLGPQRKGEASRFTCRLATSADSSSMVLNEMLAKEVPASVNHSLENLCQAHAVAEKFAQEFNMKLQQLSKTEGSFLLRNVLFLPYSVMVLQNVHIRDEPERAVLVREFLGDAEEIVNDNKCKHAEALDLDAELRKLEEEREERNLFGGGIHQDVLEEEEGPSSLEDLSVSDYLGAFSHFTYVSSERKLLVYDFDVVASKGTPTVKDDVSAPILVKDPVLHHNYGDEDSTTGLTLNKVPRGGIQRFFQNHRCSLLCQHLLQY